MQNEFDNMTLKDFENRGQDLLTRANQLVQMLVQFMTGKGQEFDGVFL